MASTILKLSKEPFVRGPFRFVHMRSKTEGKVLYNEAIALMEGFLYASSFLPGY